MFWDMYTPVRPPPQLGEWAYRQHPSPEWGPRFAYSPHLLIDIRVVSIWDDSQRRPLPFCSSPCVVSDGTLSSQESSCLLQVCGTRPGTPQAVTCPCWRNPKSAQPSLGTAAPTPGPTMPARVVTCSSRSLLYPLLLPWVCGPLVESDSPLSHCT